MTLSRFLLWSPVLLAFAGSLNGSMAATCAFIIPRDLTRELEERIASDARDDEPEIDPAGDSSTR